MRKCFIVFLIFILLFSSCRKEEESPDTKVKEGKAEYKLLAELPFGNKEENKLGYINGKVIPDTFFVFDDGLIAVIDIYKNRIAEYKNNEFVRGIEIDKCTIYECSIVADDERYYIFIYGLRTVKVQIINRKDGLLEKEIPIPKEHVFGKIFIWDGNVYYKCNGVRYLLEDDMFITDEIYLKMEKEESQYTVNQYGHEWQFSRSENDHYDAKYYYMGVDKNYNLFIEKYCTGYNSESEVIIYKYNKKNKVVGYAVLQKGFYSKLITEDGDIYVLTEEKGKKIKVYELILGNSD